MLDFGLFVLQIIAIREELLTTDRAKDQRVLQQRHWKALSPMSFPAMAVLREVRRTTVFPTPLVITPSWQIAAIDGTSNL